ncbi:MAG: DMT family transporter [Pseudomonadota bacterium]
MRRSYLPPLSIVAGMMVLALSDNFVWMISDLMSVWQYHALRALIILPGMAFVIWMLGQARTIWPQRPLAVFARATFSVAALMFYFAALPTVGVSLAAAGLFTSPVFVILISVIVFRDRVGWHRGLAVVLGFVGVCLVLEIGQTPLRAIAVAPVLGGVFYALSVIWTRRYCRQETPGCLAFWNMSFFLMVGVAGIAATPWLAAAIGHIQGTGFATIPLQGVGWRELGIVFGMGIAGAVGMVCLAYGYAGAPSSYAALFDYSFLLWIPLFAWMLWGETLTWNMFAGMALIIGAGALAIGGLWQRAVADS